MGRTRFKGKTIGVDIPLGGEEGQFLVKRTDADDDFEWGSVSEDISPTSNAPVSSKAVAEALETKVDKEEGKGLSTEDFTTAEKTKLDGINLSDYVPVSSKGQANGVASLDGNGRVPYSQLPESAMEFKGTWNASTNTPTLTAGQGTNGDFYVVSVGGTWNNITFNANDRVLYDGVTAHDWVKLVAGEVNSVNGQSGTVQLNADDIPFDNTGTSLSSTDVQGAIEEAYANDGVDVAPEFSTSTAYGVGDYVTYNGATYRFTANKTAGDWDSTKVTSVYIAGQYVTAGRNANTTLGSCATAEGYDTTASGSYSHTEGFWTTASGDYSHAEGYSTIASGSHSHAEGLNTTAGGNCSHAEGFHATASGDYSHAEGRQTTASGDYSHAEGEGTQTGADYQHVQGQYNVGKTTTLFEIGNGTSSSARSNAFEVDTDGNVVAGGTITDGQGHVLGSGGHVIKDETGTSVTQRENLQFVGLNVDDDGTNTVVSDPVFTGTTAEWTAVTDKSKYKIVNLTDDGETGDVVDAVTDGDMRPVTSNAVADMFKPQYFGITWNEHIPASGNRVTAFRMGNLAVITAMTYGDGTVLGTSDVVGTVDSSVRPSTEVEGVGTLVDSSNVVRVAKWTLRTSGKIQQVSSNAFSGQGTFAFVYPIND